MEHSKLSVISDYDKLDEDLKEQVKLAYPSGFSNSIVEFTNKKRKKILAIRLETSDTIYMLRLSKKMVNQILEEDDEW